jgi:hypothetical protein
MSRLKIVLAALYFVPSSVQPIWVIKSEIPPAFQILSPGINPDNQPKVPVETASCRWITVGRSKKSNSIGAAIAEHLSGWGFPAPQQDFPHCAFLGNE